MPANPSRPLPPRGPHLTRPLDEAMRSEMAQRADFSATPPPYGMGERQMGRGNTGNMGYTPTPTPQPPLPPDADDYVPAPGSMSVADLIGYEGPLSGPLGPTSNPLGAPLRMPRPELPEERE